jgi:hypothetical protein
MHSNQQQNHRGARRGGFNNNQRGRGGGGGNVQKTVVFQGKTQEPENFWTWVPKGITQYMFNNILSTLKTSLHEDIVTFKSVVFNHGFKSTTDLYNNTLHTHLAVVEASEMGCIKELHVQKTHPSMVPQESIDRRKSIHSAATRYTYLIPLEAGFSYRISMTMYKFRKNTSYSVKAIFPYKCDLVSKNFSGLVQSSFLKSDVIQNYNSVFSSFFSKKPYIDQSVPYTDHFTPKNISRSSTNVLPYMKDYAVQPKLAKSITKFCYFGDASVHLIDQYTVVPLILDISDDLDGTVVIGEYQLGVFWATDVLFFKKEDLTGKTLSERIIHLHKVWGMFGYDQFKILPYYTDSCIPNSIDQAVAFSEAPVDGLIFKALYLPFYDKSFFKWKSSQNSTMDLKVFYSHIDGNKQVYSLYATGPSGLYSLESFGSASVPIDVVKCRFGMDQIPSESIVEFGYKEVELSPICIRRDKAKPNFVVLADQIWEQMTDPITLDTLKDLTTDLVDCEASNSHNYAVVNKYITLTLDPTIFSLLNTYIFSSDIPQMFGEEAIRSVKEDKSPCEMNKILYEYFTMENVC